MIYRGFNKVELKKITDILDRHNVKYQTSVPDTALDYINDPTKRVNHKFMDSLLQIEIEADEFAKISQTDLSKLFDLRIYKEEESPFSEEELSSIGTESASVKAAPSDDKSRINQIAAILAIGVVSLFFLWRHGLI